jgi:hypothetical protein
MEESKQEKQEGKGEEKGRQAEARARALPSSAIKGGEIREASCSSIRNAKNCWIKTHLWSRGRGAGRRGGLGGREGKAGTQSPNLTLLHCIAGIQSVCVCVCVRRARAK